MLRCVNPGTVAGLARRAVGYIRRPSLAREPGVFKTCHPFCAFSLGFFFFHSTIPVRRPLHQPPPLEPFGPPKPPKIGFDFDLHFGIFVWSVLAPKMAPKWSQNEPKIIQKSILNSVPFSVPFLIDCWMIFGAHTLPKTMVSPYRSFKNRTSRPFWKKL